MEGSGGAEMGGGGMYDPPSEKKRGGREGSLIGR